MKRKFEMTQEEKEIEKSLETDVWYEAPNALKEEIIQTAKSGVDRRKREARVNIRLNQGDVDLIRQKADEEGLGYQTLMSSVLHKYATDRLVEKKFLRPTAQESDIRGLDKLRSVKKPRGK